MSICCSGSDLTKSRFGKPSSWPLGSSPRVTKKMKEPHHKPSSLRRQGSRLDCPKTATLNFQAAKRVLCPLYMIPAQGRECPGGCGNAIAKPLGRPALDAGPTDFEWRFPHNLTSYSGNQVAFTPRGLTRGSRTEVRKKTRRASSTESQTWIRRLRGNNAIVNWCRLCRQRCRLNASCVHNRFDAT